MTTMAPQPFGESPGPFQGVHFNAIDGADEHLDRVGIRSMNARVQGRDDDHEEQTFNREEAAARYYLARLARFDDRTAIRGLSQPTRAEVVPDLRLQDTQRSPLTRTWTVGFVQTHGSIPIFGSRAVVELDGNRELLSVDGPRRGCWGVAGGDFVAPRGSGKDCRVHAGRAWDSPSVDPSQLRYFHAEESNSWHLA